MRLQAGQQGELGHTYTRREVGVASGWEEPRGNEGSGGVGARSEVRGARSEVRGASESKERKGRRRRDAPEKSLSQPITPAISLYGQIFLALFIKK